MFEFPAGLTKLFERYVAAAETRALAESALAEVARERLAFERQYADRRLDVDTRHAVAAEAQATNEVKLDARVTSGSETKSVSERFLFSLLRDVLVKTGVAPDEQYAPDEIARRAAAFLRQR